MKQGRQSFRIRNEEGQGTALAHLTRESVHQLEIEGIAQQKGLGAGFGTNGNDGVGATK
jgi:hypothetical protein